MGTALEEPPSLATATGWLWNHRKKVATVVAGVVILALLFWLRDLVYLLLTLATALLVPAFLAGLVYGRGSEKAFCIGGLSASTMVALLLGSGLQQLTINPILLWPMVWGWIVLSGGVSLAVQNYLNRRHSKTMDKWQ